jgi:hypothetical protein
MVASGGCAVKSSVSAREGNGEGNRTDGMGEELDGAAVSFSSSVGGAGGKPAAHGGNGLKEDETGENGLSGPGSGPHRQLNFGRKMKMKTGNGWAAMVLWAEFSLGR